MTQRTVRLKQFAAMFVAAATIAVCLAVAERGKSADADPVPTCTAAGKTESRYMGADSCSLCHAGGNTSRAPSELATLDEFSTWDHRDRHRLAFKALRSPRAKDMETLLGMKPGEAATTRQCIACHAIEVTADTAGPTLPDAASQHAAIEQGVGCEACHGRASLWIDRHWKPGEWSALKPPLNEQKYDQYSMTNLRDPVRRSELCLSCHLGDIACGKFVTHDMFAAGHPPLPAFEIEAFLEQMPPHWRARAPLSRTRSVALEGLVALRASVRLLADASRPPQPQAPANSGRIDFAVYDCTACHHELEIPSARQERGYFGSAPGRPSPRAWNLPLAMAAIKPSALDAALAKLQSATRSRPFGDAQEVHGAARDVVSQLDQAIAEVQNKPIDSAESRQLVENICRRGAETSVDYESAWQLTGALRAIVLDTDAPASGKTAAPVDPKIKSLVEELSVLVNFPTGPDSSSGSQAKDRGALWQNGEGFKSEQFREKLGEVGKLVGDR